MQESRHTGRCLCGAVRYELRADVETLSNCHCQYCRRAHGSAFVTTTAVETDRLVLTQGEESIAKYAGRYFCNICATRLFNRSDTFPKLTILMVASLDSQPTFTPAIHMNVESMAPWYRILDERLQYQGFPPDIEAALKATEDPA